MSQKDFTVYGLYTIYGALLTERQRSAVEDYYGLDLSLAEIAEIRSISRQAVKDALDKAQITLRFYEDKLGFYGRIEAIKQLNCSDASALKADIIKILEDK